MFFDKVLVENSELRRVWRAGFGRMEDPEENASFPNICRDIEECVGSHDPDPRRRLSLRTSSVLVEGAARIYRQELEHLMEDISEVHRVLTKRKSTDSQGDTSTDSSTPPTPENTPEHMRRQMPRHSDSSTPSTPDDTPEHMRRQMPRHSDVSIQRPDNETIASLKAFDLSHHLSSISKSTNSQKSSQNDDQNGQSPKRRKLTGQRNRSSEYPSSPDLTTDRNSEDPISAEELDLADENQTSEQPTQDAEGEFDSDEQVTRKSDQNETEKSSEEENAPESPNSPTFTEKFEYVAALPNYDPDSVIPEIHEDRTKSMADKSCEEIISEAQNDAVKNSDIDRVDLAPILPTLRKVLRNSLRVTKKINRSLMKKDQVTQTDHVSFHPDVSERDRSANVNLPFGYLLIHDTYSSRYPSKIVMSSMYPFA